MERVCLGVSCENSFLVADCHQQSETCEGYRGGTTSIDVERSPQPVVLSQADAFLSAGLGKIVGSSFVAHQANHVHIDCTCIGHW